MPAVRRAGFDGVVDDGGRASGGTAGTGAARDGAIGVMGAMMLIDRPRRQRSAPRHTSPPVAAPAVAVLLTAAALVRVAGRREITHDPDPEARRKRSRRRTAGSSPGRATASTITRCT
ncbi:hypothetical protein ACWEPC_16980 [Nonomuraea sp. NPDC004297]